MDNFEISFQEGLKRIGPEHSCLVAGVEKDDKQKLAELFAIDAQKGKYEIANYISQKYKFKTVESLRDDELYVYQDGIYSDIGAKRAIRSEIYNILGEKTSVNQIKEITEQIKTKNYVEERKTEFGEKDPNLICVNNGILNIKTKELKPHSPDYVFLRKIPVCFDESADCPMIKQFFKDVLYTEDIPIVQEFFGYSLYRDYFIKKAVILTGETGGGKTTLLELLLKFIGSDNIAGVSLQKLKDRFSSASLYQKYLNVYDDLDAQDVMNSGYFKMITGRSPITGEQKFKESFQFFNFAKMIFAANRIPRVKDLDDDAYYSRWIVIRCDNIFDDDNPRKDPHIIEKITSNEEMSGLLNYSLSGLERLLKNNKFSYAKSTEEVKTIMQRESDPIAAFVGDALEESASGWISKVEMYIAYKSYAKENLYPIFSKEKIGRDLEKYATFLADSRGSTTGKERGWRNVRLKNPQKEPESGEKSLNFPDF